MASGINSTFRQVGIATGIAGWGAIFQHKVADEFTSRLMGRASADAADFVAFGGATRQGGQLARAAEQAFIAGLDRILLLAALVAFVGALLSGLLVRPQDFA